MSVEEVEEMLRSTDEEDFKNIVEAYFDPLKDLGLDRSYYVEWIKLILLYLEGGSDPDRVRRILEYGRTCEGKLNANH
jgi:hypothetical protein